MISNNKKGIERCIFVALGSFNPAILHPQWFARHSILPVEEIEGLLAEPFKKEIPEIGATIEFGSRFLVEPTHALANFKSFFLRVDRGKFEVKCEKQEGFPLLLSFIKKIFLVLPETPISAYGINFDEHIQFAESSSSILSKFFSKNPIVAELFCEDCDFGHNVYTKIKEARVRFRIEPSQVLEDGILLSMNFHYDNPSSDNKFLTDMLDTHFEDALTLTSKIVAGFGEIKERVEKLKK